MERVLVARWLPSVDVEGETPRMAESRLVSYWTGWGRTGASCRSVQLEVLSLKMWSFILIQNLGWLNRTWTWEGAKTTSIHPETPAGPAHTPRWTSVMALLIQLLYQTTSLDRTKSKWEVWVLGWPLWLWDWCAIVGNHSSDCQAPLAILLLSRQLAMNRLRGLLITLPFLIAFDFYQQLEGRKLLCREILENCPLSKGLSLLWCNKTEFLLEEDVKHSRWAEAVAGRLWEALPC